MSAGADHDVSAETPERPRRVKTLLVCAVIVVVAAAVAAFTLLTEPEAERGGATRKSAMLVEVTTAERGDYRPVLVATGTAMPAQDVVLRPQVGGAVIEQAEAFSPGSFVEEGEVLIRIEPADYRNAVQQRRGDLRLALSELQIERGRQDVARSGYELVEEDVPGVNRDLVLRKPQLEAAEERVEAARAAVDQALLDLERTTIRAPFAAQVLSRDVSLGARVAPGDALGRLVGLEELWVAVTVPAPKVRWISVSEGTEEEGSLARVRNRAAWPAGVYREGRVFRRIYALDERTRMVRILVTIPDPFSVTESEEPRPPVMVDEFLEVEIVGKELRDVVRIESEHVREGDTVWVMEDGALQIREVDVLLQDAEHAYIARGLEGDETIVTSDLSTVTEGARLRVEGTDPDASLGSDEPREDVDE